MRDLLESWQAEIIKPVDDWEEQERLEAEAIAAKLEAEKLTLQIENDHEFALFMNADFDTKKLQAQAEAESARIAREKQIADEVAAAAIAQAERKHNEELANMLELSYCTGKNLKRLNAPKLKRSRMQKPRELRQLTMLRRPALKPLRITKTPG